MLIGNENKAHETQLTSAGWAPQQGWFGKACCGTEWLQLWTIIPYCSSLLRGSAHIRASAGTLLTVRTCRAHRCCGTPVTRGLTSLWLWGWEGIFSIRSVQFVSVYLLNFFQKNELGANTFAKKCHRLLLFFVYPPLCCLPLVLVQKSWFREGSEWGGPRWLHTHAQLNRAENTPLQGVREGSGCFLLIRAWMLSKQSRLSLPTALQTQSKPLEPSEALLLFRVWSTDGRSEFYCRPNKDLTGPREASQQRMVFPLGKENSAPKQLMFAKVK